jgi:hypothetical protein
VRWRFVVALLVASGSSTGCATIVSDADYPVVFSSEPPGADVTVRDENGRLVHHGQTPSPVSLEAHDGFFDAMRYEAHFEKDCHEAAAAALEANLDEWYWGNFLFGGLIGFLLLDPATGAMWELEGAVNAVLAPKEPCESPGSS